MQVKNIDARLTLNGDCEVILTVPKGERDNIKSLIDEFKSKMDKVWEANMETMTRLETLKQELELVKSLKCLSFDLKGMVIAHYEKEIECAENNEEE